MPQLDDPDIGVAHPVDDGLEVVDDDDVDPGEQPREPEPVPEPAPSRDALLEQRQELVVAVDAPLHHAVVDHLQVPAKLRPRVGAEQDPAAGATGERPECEEQDLEQAPLGPPEPHDRWPGQAPGQGPRIRDGAGAGRRSKLDVERQRAGSGIDARRGHEFRAADGEHRGGDGRVDRPGADDRDGSAFRMGGRGRDEPPAARLQRDLARPLHHVEAQDDVVSVLLPAGGRRIGARSALAVEPDLPWVDGRPGGPAPKQDLDPAPGYRHEIDGRGLRRDPAGR